MLESYYVRPQAVGRIRASWIGSEIERYVIWLAEQRYSCASVRRRVPVLVAFGEFARAGGARSVGDLPAHVEAFVAERVPELAQLGAVAARERVKNVRGPIEQMLRLVVPGFTGSRRPLLEVPFIDNRRAPGVLRVLAVRARASPHHAPRVRVLFEELRGLPATSRGQAVGRALAGADQRVRRGAVRRPGDGERRAAVWSAARVPAVRTSPGRARQRPEQDGGSAAELPALRHSAIDHAGGSEPGARVRGPEFDPRQARLRRSGAARDLRPSQP
jgi:hypothetical protein